MEIAKTKKGGVMIVAKRSEVLVTKGQVVELVSALINTGRPFEQYEFEDKLICLPPPARIEAAIEKLDNRTARFPKRSPFLADLLRWGLGQKQDTWSDEELGLKEVTPNQKGG